MIQINLIPDVKQELLRAQTQRNVVISVAILAAIVAGAIVLLVAGYVYGAQALLMQSSNRTIDDEYAKLSSVEDLDKMLTVQNQLNAVSTLNKSKYVTSRLYDMLNVVVPESPHDVKISSLDVTPVGAGEAAADTGEDGESTPAQGAVITIEGQTVGGYASLEVFEKMIAAAVIEYKAVDGGNVSEGELNCGDAEYLCRYLTVGGGERSLAVNVSEMNFSENQDNQNALFFKLSFTVNPELFSNDATDVRIKIGQDGNVTDSYQGIPRAIFEERPATEEEE